MSLLTILTVAQGGQLILNLARTYRSDEDATRKTVEGVLPILTKALQDKTSDVKGLDEVVTFLKKSDLDKYLDDPDSLSSESLAKDGARALAALGASEGQLTRLVSLLSGSTGLSGAVVQTMLPAIVSLAMAGLSRGLAKPDAQARLKTVNQPPSIIGWFSSIFGGSGAGHAGSSVFGAVLEAGVDGDEEWAKQVFGTV